MLARQPASSRPAVAPLAVRYAQPRCSAPRRPPPAPRPSPPSLPSPSARYRGKGTDLTKVEGFKKTSDDTGSAEYQIARLSARVLQLTSHLQKHTKDYSTRRGLMAILSQRKQLMLYLQRTNRAEYDRICAELRIRPLKNEAA